MRLVQKYGGSSVADVSRIRRVAERVAAARRAGHEVVVVVSAMGNSTNELLALARQVSPQPGRRELDMLLSVGERVSMALLAMALGELQIPARSFTGSQSGILTDEAHAAARVIEVRPERIEAALAAGEVAIVAGFQGMSLSREITTLGRGGSDTTAVVLAAALRADECEICSDVDGIWSADPRTVPGARKIDDMSLAEALALARNGAKVLFEDAVAWAERQGIALRASATAGGTGTRIRPEGPAAPRMLAVTRDEELGFLALDRLADIPVPCVRIAGPWGVLVDRRNLHGALAGMEPAATVAAVGARIGQDPRLLHRLLSVATTAHWHVTSWHATVDAVLFRLPPERSAALEKALHDLLD